MRLYLGFALILFYPLATAASELRFDGTSAAVDVPLLLHADKATAVFRFTNSSDKPISIMHVKPACDCTHVEFTQGEIAPGKRGAVTVSVSLTSGPGAFAEGCEVFPSAGEPIELTVFVTIPPSAVLSASKLTWKAGENADKTVSVRAVPFTSMHVDSVSLADTTTAKAVIEEITPNYEYRIHFSPITEDPEFYTSASVTITTGTGRREGTIVLLRRETDSSSGK